MGLRVQWGYVRSVSDVVFLLRTNFWQLPHVAEACVINALVSHYTHTAETNFHTNTGVIRQRRYQFRPILKLIQQKTCHSIPKCLCRYCHGLLHVLIPGNVLRFRFSNRLLFLYVLVCVALHRVIWRSSGLPKPKVKCHVTTFWRRNYFFLILAHPVYKMWIIKEPNKLELWNKLHFEEKNTESIHRV